MIGIGVLRDLFSAGEKGAVRLAEHEGGRLVEGVGREAAHISKTLPEDIVFSSQRKGNLLQVVGHKASEKPDFISSLQYGSVFGTIDDAAKNVHLNLVTVNKEGQGVGKGLVARFAEEAQTHGAQTMTGDIRNPKALSNRLKIFSPGRTTEVPGGEIFGQEATHITNLRGWRPSYGQSLRVSESGALQQAKTVPLSIETSNRLIPKAEVPEQIHGVALRVHGNDGVPQAALSQLEHTLGQLKQDIPKNLSTIDQIHLVTSDTDHARLSKALGIPNFGGIASPNTGIHGGHNIYLDVRGVAPGRLADVATDAAAPLTTSVDGGGFGATIAHEVGHIVDFNLRPHEIDVNTEMMRHIRQNRETVSTLYERVTNAASLTRQGDVTAAAQETNQVWASVARTRYAGTAAEEGFAETFARAHSSQFRKAHPKRADLIEPYIDRMQKLSEQKLGEPLTQTVPASNAAGMPISRRLNKHKPVRFQRTPSSGRIGGVPSRTKALKRLGR